MPDIYVDVGPMAYSKDTTKVASKYAVNAQKQMRDVAAKAIRSAPGFTMDKVGNPEGYSFNAKLTEITFGTYQGQPSVTCKVNGEVGTYPKPFMLTTSLSGSATVAGGTTDRDVSDCIKEAMRATVEKRVIPYLRLKPTTGSPKGHVRGGSRRAGPLGA
jgi:hypothetical protein